MALPSFWQKTSPAVEILRAKQSEFQFGITIGLEKLADTSRKFAETIFRDRPRLRVIICKFFRGGYRASTGFGKYRQEID
jgi:hypothetical protein